MTKSGSRRRLAAVCVSRAPQWLPGVPVSGPPDQGILRCNEAAFGPGRRRFPSFLCGGDRRGKESWVIALQQIFRSAERRSPNFKVDFRRD